MRARTLLCSEMRGSALVEQNAERFNGYLVVAESPLIRSNFFSQRKKSTNLHRPWYSPFGRAKMELGVF